MYLFGHRMNKDVICDLYNWKDMGMELYKSSFVCYWRWSGIKSNESGITLPY